MNTCYWVIGIKGQDYRQWGFDPWSFQEAEACFKALRGKYDSGWLLCRATQRVIMEF